MIGISDHSEVGFGLKSFAFQNLLLRSNKYRTGIVNSNSVIHCFAQTIK
jgi:hypothetical protein